jgi:copper oxidase (laccase) domain-containing protein
MRPPLHPLFLISLLTLLTQCGTVADGSRFFSFRRDGVTGRHAAAVWRH